jgi:DNA transformation protein
MKPGPFKDFVLDQLAAMPDIEARAMFGGHGLYCGEIFFAVLFKGRLYFKTSTSSRVEYARRGMKPFRPSDKQSLKRYYEVPAEIMEDRDKLVEWARSALAADEPQ